MPFDPQTGLYYESTGPQDAPTIVFLHGGGVSGWMWRKQVEELSPCYHCLVPDLPEQGRSVDVGPFTVEFAAKCVASLISSTAHNGRAHVIGLSEGAQILVALLARDAGLVNRAVCSSAILRPLPGQFLYTRGLFALGYRWFLAPFKHNDAWIRLNMHGSAGIGEEYFENFKKSFQGTTESGFVNLMVQAMHFRLPAGLETVQTPVLVVTGKHEYAQMRASARDLLTVLPNARGAVVDLGKGSSLAKEHNWALSAPELFTETVKRWLENQPVPEAIV